MNVHDTLYISMFGGFSIQHEQGEASYKISERDKASRRMWTFLQYLTAFRQKAVSQDELIEALWSRREVEKPVNTLKTLLHRARAMVETIGFEDGKQVLLYRRGYYQWNPELNIVIDTEEFERLCACSGELANDTELDAALGALAQYSGEFLPGAIGSPWSIPLRAYYHDRYFKLCGDTATALGIRGRYAEAIGICRTATMVDPYHEPVQLRLMQLLAESGAQQAAIQHYAEVSGLLMDELGVVPSQEMTALYRELSKSAQNVERDLNVVRRALSEVKPEYGAFFCQYAVFRDIYRLKARAARRSGQVVQLVMLTLLSPGGGRMDAEQCSVAMLTLRHVIHDCLRCGDIFTRASAAQYLLLLPSASYENSVKVVGRILRAFHGKRTIEGATCEYSLLPVLPVSYEGAAQDQAE